MPQDHMISILFEDGLPRQVAKRSDRVKGGRRRTDVFRIHRPQSSYPQHAPCRFSFFGHHRLSRSRPCCDASSESLNFRRKLLLCDNRIPACYWQALFIVSSPSGPRILAALVKILPSAGIVTVTFFDNLPSVGFPTDSLHFLHSFGETLVTLFGAVRRFARFP